MKKGKTLLTIIVNILFICFLISGCVFLYNITGRKNISEIAATTEKAVYKEKPSIPEINKDTINETLPPLKKYHFKYIFNISVNDKIDTLTFKIPVPYDENEKQYITNKNFSPEPSKIYKEGENTFAEFIFAPMTDNMETITIEGTANVRTYNLSNAKALNKNITPEKDLTQYLKPEPYIESDDPLIKSTAAKIQGSNEEETVKNIYHFVNKNLEYKIVPGLFGAKRALTDKSGKCSEFAALTVALCRAEGIPARVISGNMAKEDKLNKHSWVEVYFKEFGWVNFDPTIKPAELKKYVNGNLVGTELKYEYEKSDIDYIASIKNNLSPWFLKINSKTPITSRPMITEDFQITPAE